jgi:hypothetical protein
MKFVSDCDVWNALPVEWTWIYDKLIVARRQNIVSGPAGVSVPSAGLYIVRPITNIRMMGKGAKKCWLDMGDDVNVPDGYFWSEVLTGDHISVDYHWGVPVLSVQGFREDPDRLDRFSRWVKTPIKHTLPDWLFHLSKNQEWINVEYIGDKIIEVHLRYNDDFTNHDADEIIPVWKNENSKPPVGWEWYESPAGDRLGFWIKLKN